MSDRERIEYLAAMVVSGAADAEETAELEALIESVPEAEAIFREMEEAMAEVSLSEVMPPPEANLERIRQRVSGVSSGVPPGQSEAPPGAAIISLAARRKLRTMAVVTTVSVAAAAGFAVMWQTERQVANEQSKRADSQSLRANAVERRYVESKDKLTVATAELEDARKRLGLIRGAEVQLATIRKDDGAGAKIFMDPQGKKWLVYAHQLPKPAADKDYQLWFVPKTGGNGPIPAGLMRVSGDVLEAQIEVPSGIPEIGQAAISLEPKGGSKTPTDVQMIGPI